MYVKRYVGGKFTHTKIFDPRTLIGEAIIQRWSINFVIGFPSTKLLWLVVIDCRGQFLFRAFVKMCSSFIHIFFYFLIHPQPQIFWQNDLLQYRKPRQIVIVQKFTLVLYDDGRRYCVVQNGKFSKWIHDFWTFFRYRNSVCSKKMSVSISKDFRKAGSET